MHSDNRVLKQMKHILDTAESLLRLSTAAEASLLAGDYDGVRDCVLKRETFIRCIGDGIGVLNMMIEDALPPGPGTREDLGRTAGAVRDVLRAVVVLDESCRTRLEEKREEMQEKGTLDDPRTLWNPYRSRRPGFIKRTVCTV